MAVVRAFKDPQNRARLKALPTQLFNEALAERDALIQAAVTAELALAHSDPVGRSDAACKSRRAPS